MVSRVGSEMEQEENFSIDWIGNQIVSQAILLSTINATFLSKLRAKKTERMKEKLPIVENAFQPLSNYFMVELEGNELAGAI